MALSSVFTLTKRKQQKQLRNKLMIVFGLFFILTGCSPTKQTMNSSDETSSPHQSTAIKEDISTNDHQKQASIKQDNHRSETLQSLANKEFDGTQTITINHNLPQFSKEDLSIDKGGWEKYGELDSLNRATSAEAMLNQSIMPTKKRGSISNVKPSGWKNKKIKGGYLYNRSHLIGHALAGEDDNWQNLITGTSQLNNPEMLRHEMDVKHYLDQSANHYVRYSVTPIYRDNELVARGVQMQAQSIGDNALQFNIYIFNVQDGVTINYQDGSSQIETTALEQTTTNKSNSNTQHTATTEIESVFITPSGSRYHTHPHGKGNFKPATLQEAKEKGYTPCKVCY
ncbi:DNA/RNA non-specific endonuclease [Vagococcus sp.]|uniref:DNA/RNA non-specific endonuclease n=1 Tax=Vagococcus sp. TaxID=1933889 RepID=UPI003F9A5FAC